MAQATKFLLVMTVSPRGTFRRAALEFSRDWRAVQVGDETDLEAAIPTLDEASVAKLRAEAMLVVKDASASDVEGCLAQLAATKQDKDQVISDLQKKNADLETRLMKLELAAATPAKKPAEKPAEKNDTKVGLGDAKG